MKRALCTGLAIVGVWSQSHLLGATANAQSHAVSKLACPSTRDMQEMTQWRNRMAQMTLHGQVQEARSQMEECFGTDPRRIPRCAQDVYDYTNQILEGRGLTFENESNQQMTLQNERQLPPEFLVKNEHGQVVPGVLNFPEGIHDIARQKGWHSVTYKTRSSGGFDNAPNLTLVAIPQLAGQNVDVYLQISPPPKPGENHHHSIVDQNLVSPHKGQRFLTIITVDKRKSPPEGDLRLLSYNEIKGGYEWANRSRGMDGTCFECHSNPLRNISPRGYQVVNTFMDLGRADKGFQKETWLDRSTTESVDKINKMMDVSELRWHRPLVQSSSPDGRRRSFRWVNGPQADWQPYGWAARDRETRSDDFLKACIKKAGQKEKWTYTGFGNYHVELPVPKDFEQKVDLKQVRKGMNCVSCHSNSERGYLHERFSMKEITFKVLIDRSMPPHDGDYKDDGTPDEPNIYERMALIQCLQDEFHSNLGKEAWKKSGDWMTRSTCAPANTAAGESSNGDDTTAGRAQTKSGRN